MQLENNGSQPSQTTQNSLLQRFQAYFFTLTSFFLKHKWVSAFIALLLISVVLQFFVQRRLPTSDSIPEVSQPTVETENNYLPAGVTVTFTGDIPQFENQLVVYQVTMEPLEQNARTLANRLNLNPVSGFDNYWMSADQLQSVSYEPREELIQYSIQYQDAAPTIYSQNDGLLETNNSIDLQLAQANATTTLNSLGIRDFVLNSAQITFLYGELTVEETEQKRIEGAIIPFYYTINDYPFVPHSYTRDFTQVKVDAQSRVTEVLFSYIISNVQEHSFVASNSIESTLQQIKDGRGVITDLSGDSLRVIDVDSLQSVTLNNVVLEYRFNSSSSLAIPYFVFTGSATDNTNSQLDIEIVVPAIPVTKAQ